MKSQKVLGWGWWKERNDGESWEIIGWFGDIRLCLWIIHSDWTPRSWHTLGRRPRTFVAFLLIGVGWGGVITFICTSSHTWCYVIVWGGVGWGNNVHLHFLTYMMLRYYMSACTFSHTWYYATSCRLALPHIHDTTLLHGRSMWMRLPKSQDIPWCQTTSKRWWTNGSLDFRQSLGPITPIAFLEELKQLLKQWGKKGYEVLLRSSLEQCKMRNVKKHWIFLLKIPFRATAVYQACT